MFKGFKPLWLKNVICQAVIFKTGPKAVIGWTQNQANYETSASPYVLIYVMFQVEHCFIHVLLFTEPGSLSVKSVSVGNQPGGQS